MSEEDANVFEREQKKRNVVPLRPEAEAKPARTLDAVWADDIDLALDAGGVVDGLLPLEGMTVLYGESGAGKTFNALDLACHVAAGMPWRGMAVEQGVVVYVAAEAPSSVKRRIWAWKKHHEHRIERLPVLVVQSSIDLLNGDTNNLVAKVRQTAHQHGRIAMVVIDTLARAMIGNENAPDDMGRFVAATAAIREAARTHVLVVHHSGKDTAKGARGHSCLRAATDVELEVTPGCIKVTKARDDEGGRTYGFRLEPFELGVNAKGRTVATCVAVPDVPPVPVAKTGSTPRLTDDGKLVLQAVEKAAQYKGQQPPDHPETRAVALAVTKEDARLYWRQLIGWDHLSREEREASRKHWDRGLKNAQAARVVRQWDCWLWFSKSRP